MNIEDCLVRAFRAADRWTVEAALHTAATIKGDRAATIDWDSGAGEEWISVDGAGFFAFISPTFPLAMAERGSVDPTALQSEVVTIFADGFNVEELTCSLAVLYEVFGDSADFSRMDPNSFSVHDLWYATI
jgi:hypothetical protein